MPSVIIVAGKDVDCLLSDPEVLSLAIADQRQLFIDFYLANSSASQHAQPEPIQIPHRMTVVSAHHKVLFMPSRYAGQGETTTGTTGIKVVSVPTRSGDQSGLPGTTMVLDEETGGLKGIVNSRKLTAVRNACGSALFCSLFHPFQNTQDVTAGPKKLVIFGSGQQAQLHALVLHSNYRRTLKEIVIVARSQTSRLSKLVSELNTTLGGTCAVSSIMDSPGNTLGDADIIVTCTPSSEPLFDSRSVAKGTILCLIGSYQPHMQEIDQDLVGRAGMIAVDSKSACLKEAGELIMAKKGQDDLVEIGDLLQRREEILISEDVRIYKSVGIGIQDVAIAKCILELAGQRGLGTTIEDYDE